MKYSPEAKEMEFYPSASNEDRFQYCMHRIVEAEEVWGLAEPQGWVISEVKEDAALPIWPYKEFANNSRKAEWENAQPQAISLEHFVYKVSQMLIENDIKIEVMPTPDAAGHVMEAKTFFKILENVMESGEYFMEG